MLVQRLYLPWECKSCKEEGKTMRRKKENVKDVAPVTISCLGDVNTCHLSFIVS